jgi:hypothetical protein
MASKYGHSIEEVVHMAHLANKGFCSNLKERLNGRLPPELALREDRVFNFFHVRKFKVGHGEKQNTYIFDPDAYAEYFVS